LIGNAITKIIAYPKYRHSLINFIITVLIKKLNILSQDETISFFVSFMALLVLSRFLPFD